MQSRRRTGKPTDVGRNRNRTLGGKETRIILTTGTIGRFEYEKILYDPGEAVPPYEYETLNVCLLLSGTCLERRADRRYEHRGPSLTINPPSATHEIAIGAGGAICLSLDVPADWSADVEQVEGPCPRPVIALTDPTAVLQGVRLHEELLHPDDLTPMSLEEGLLDLLSIVGGDSSRPGEPDAGDALPPWLARVREQLDDAPADCPGLAALAAEAGVHRVHLARRFRRHYGVSVGAYARRNRMRNALVEIANSDEDFGRIALRAGYYDQAHFNHRFRQHAGMTPTRFRRLVRDLST